MARGGLIGRRKPRAGLAGGGQTPDDGGGVADPPAPAPARRTGPIGALRGCYEDLVSAVIRPPRAEYQLHDLGPPHFKLERREYIREDVQVKNASGLTLECSWWQPYRSSQGRRPCVVYMHGNSSCRIEAMEHLEMVLGMGVTLFAFDFAGCGMSEGDTITLGWNEKNDTRCVIDFLRASGRVSTVALWGRSMGAATALMHGHRDPSIAAMILDSPFADLHQLARELAMNLIFGRKPGMLVSAALRVLRSTIQKRSGLDMFRLKPIENADSTFIPALFVAGDGDNFIAPSHCWDIHSRYAGDKNLVMVAGDHDSRRPGYLHDSIAIFLGDRLLGPAAGSPSD